MTEHRAVERRAQRVARRLRFVIGLAGADRRQAVRMKREAGRADARRWRREIRRHTEAQEDVRLVPEDVFAGAFAERRRELVLTRLQRQAVALRTAERPATPPVLPEGQGAG